MPLQFTLLDLLLIVAVIIFGLIQFAQNHKLSGLVETLATVDHSKVALDALEKIGASAPPEMVAGLLAMVSGASNLMADPTAKRGFMLTKDIIQQATDGKPNDLPGADNPLSQ